VYGITQSYVSLLARKTSQSKEFLAKKLARDGVLEAKKEIITEAVHTI